MSATAAASVGEGNGVWIFRASRLESLLQPLNRLMGAAPPSGLLQPVELVAAHPGMRRWLLNQLAAQAGRRGIAANLQIDLPGQWLERSCLRHLGERPGPAWHSGALRWRLLESLGEVASGGLPLPGFARYLKGDDHGRRRWQLASALAALYGRLLVYRGDWLLAWQHGADDVPEPTELAPLWRHLRERLPGPHRGELQERLLKRLQLAPAGDDAPLHVFGCSHLPPRLLDLLFAQTRQRVVALYLPDPCVEHWAGLGHRSTRLRELLRLPDPLAGEPLYLDIGHPLLASLGRIGQQFGLLLAAHDERTPVDLRHGEDQPDTTAPAPTLLARVQESVRQLDPQRIQPSAGGGSTLPPAQDASLRIHRCHSRLRELEVLRDALLQLLREEPTLRPADIAVLAPDMPAYAPLLAAVFGPAASTEAVLPYHVADLPATRGNPVFSSFLALVESPRQRLSAAGLIALLDAAPLRCALGLDADDVERIEFWLREARIGWGLDRQSRIDEELPAISEHSFAWGMDRLICGYLLGAQTERLPPLLDGIAPAAAVRDTQLPALAALDRLLVELHAWREFGRGEHPLSHWIDALKGLLGRLFRPEPEQLQQRESIAQLQALLGSLHAEAGAAGCDPGLSLAQVCALLDEALRQVPEHTPFLHGGISFCGMVPQRALPFRFIAVLGLDESAFPRQSTAPLFDPLPRHPRIGDRDVLADDRYLFLETLMAARGYLHLSYVAEGERDGKPRNPAAPLALLMELLDQQHGLGADDADAARPWCRQHPLQPTLHVRHRDAIATPDHAALPKADSHPRIAPAAVLRWLRDPARELLHDRLRVRLDALDADTLPEQEPLDADGDPRLALWRRLLLDALTAGETGIPAEPDPRLLAQGLLAPGRSGLRGYARQRERAQALLLQARELPLFAAGMPARMAAAIELELDGLRIQGPLHDVLIAGEQRWLLEWCKDRAQSDSMMRRLQLFWRWGLLRLADPEARCELQVAQLAPDGPGAWGQQLTALDQAWRARPEPGLLQRLQQRLAGLAGRYLQAQHAPLAYFPAATQAAAQQRDPAPAWLGGHNQIGEREYAPGYAALLAGSRTFWLPGDPAHDGFVHTARQLAQILDLGSLRGDPP